MGAHRDGHGHHDHGADAHGHAHSQARSVSRPEQRRALRWALGANALFLAIEVGGGLAFDSLALLADAGHLLSDVVALSIALIAQRLLDQPASARHTYGLQRAEVLGAQANGLVLLLVCAWISVSAIQRLGDSVAVEGGGLLVVAVAGLSVNVISAVMLARVQGDSLNMRGALTHMVLDAAGSVGAVVAGLAVVGWGADWADPVASLAIALLVLWSAWGLLRDTAVVLLEGTPRGVDPTLIEPLLRAEGGVEAVHHLHVWSLASDVAALSAHVVLEGELTLHEAQAEGERLKRLLADRLGITHSTIELECHPCDPADDHVARGPETSRHATD